MLLDDVVWVTCTSAVDVRNITDFSKYLESKVKKSEVTDKNIEMKNIEKCYFTRGIL